jgi:hypothetical protein
MIFKEIKYYSPVLLAIKTTGIDSTGKGRTPEVQKSARSLFY